VRSCKIFPVLRLRLLRLRDCSYNLNYRQENQNYKEKCKSPSQRFKERDNPNRERIFEMKYPLDAALQVFPL